MAPPRGTIPPKKKKPANKKPPSGGGGGGNKPANKGTKKKAPKKDAPKRPKTNRVLTPPFDERMRRVGSPLNNARKIKRGWLYNDVTGDRINFLFNPSQLDVSSAMDPSAVRNPNQMPDVDQGSDQFLTSTGLNLSFKLLYDRTYELYSGGKSAAHQFGVFADVAAWYVYHGMLDDIPTNWEEGYIMNPMFMVPSYLFIGPRLTYFGYVSSMAVAYSHWTQDMIPSRCAIDVSFVVLPYGGDLGGGGDTAPGTKNKKGRRRGKNVDYIRGGWGTGDLPDRGGIPSSPRGGSPRPSPHTTPGYGSTF